MGKLAWQNILALLVIAGVLEFFFLSSSGENQEIKKILSINSIAEQSQELIKLMDRVGPIEAQDQLFKSGIPFTGQSHLLVHTIGDYIYDNFGPSGLPYCRDYFLSACYHGFIINTLGDLGMEGMAEVMEKCAEAGPTVPSQCAHGAGHGFVAWHDYDLIKALEMCDILGEETANFPHFNCYDGVFMENIWGVHNGAPSEKRWVKEGEIYYPCADERIPEKYLGGCWSNQATLIYNHFKGDINKTAQACEAVINPSYRDICHNNLARQIHPITHGNKDKVASLCSLEISPERIDDCILANASAYWSVGDRRLPYEICESLSEPLKTRCFDQLVALISTHYARIPGEKKVYCGKLSSSMHRERCDN